MATHAAPTYQSKPDPDRGTTAKVVALMLGLTIPALLALALWAAVSAQKAKDDVHSATPAAPAMTTTMRRWATGRDAELAGLAPENADALAAAHKPYPAALPAAPAGAGCGRPLDAEGRRPRGRARDQVQRLGLLRRRARPGRSTSGRARP